VPLTVRSGRAFGNVVGEGIWGSAYCNRRFSDTFGTIEEAFAYFLYSGRPPFAYLARSVRG
jgi:hypothetical protein